jgi:uncharacterized protein YqjF (DUF2071 family)
VAFRLDQVRRRWLPHIWPTSAFPELNLRVYVCHCGEPAIYFLSIHAGRWLANCMARLFTPLDYIYSPIRFRHQPGGCCFECPDTEFVAEWTPEGRFTEARDGSLEHWLLERYALYVEDDRGVMLRTEVEHPPWSVCSPPLTINAGNLGTPFGLEINRLPDAVHFSAGVHAFIKPFVEIDSGKPLFESP